MIISEEFVKAALMPVDENANKYTRGSVMIIAGSYGMAGAAVLSAKAAMRSGAGIVRLVVPDSIYPVCASSLPEAVYTPIKSSGAQLDVSAYESAEPYFSKVGAVAFGPGVGTGEEVSDLLISLVRNVNVPLIIDADGINVLSGHIDILKEKSSDILLTPHEGEMARLIGKDIGFVRNNRLECAVDFAAKWGVNLLLKGKNTIIASPDSRVLVNPTGTPALATAGSGDVLTGIISATASSGTKLFDAACAGAYIHGLSGELAAEDFGVRSVIASDIIEYLKDAFKALDYKEC
ncbi:MAG: NAD(P)H-hydrate dehydratase [Ruminococcaceae bacterium]|nr:NAD(P)H-hydrate dehydratase [Oscillospiraceae bacterium]